MDVPEDHTMPNQLRQLGASEMMCHLLHQMEPPFGTYLHVAVLQCKQKVTVETADIQAALQHLIAAQPLLRTKISEAHHKTEAGDNKKFYFAPIEDEVQPIMDVRHIDTEKQWIAVCEREMNCHFTLDTGPIWKLVALNVDDTPGRIILLFIMHHAICDAKSMCDLIRNQLLPLLNLVLKSDGKPSLQEVKNIIEVMGVEPPVEDIGIYKQKSSRAEGSDAARRISIPWYAKLALQLARVRTSLLKLAEKPPPISPCDSEMPLADGEVCWKFLPLIINESLYGDIVSASRQQGVTVTCTLSTAVVVAIERELRERKRSSAGTYTIHLPVDLRRFNDTLRATPTPLGTYVGGFMLKQKPLAHYDEGKFWKRAKSLKSQVSREMHKLERKNASTLFQNVLMYLASSHSEETPIWEALEKLGFRTHVGISNAGVCDSSECDDGAEIKLLEQYFNIAGGNGRAEVLFICVISMSNNMYLLAGYNAQWLDSSFVQAILDNMIDVLTKATESSEPLA